jgi:murein DD-endopeptidase MepM/ murein hydrolase activator NlpD
VPSPSSLQPAPARRALIEDIKQDKKGWIQHGIAALAVSLLGLGIAGSVVLTGAAQHTTSADAKPPTLTTTSRTEQTDTTSRSTTRAPLDAAKAKSLADQRAEELAKAGDAVSAAGRHKVTSARDKALSKAQAATRKQAALISSGHTAKAATAKAATGTRTATPRPDASKINSGGKSCMPVTSGYSVAARFGQVGSWSRYHTGFDFSAPVGTPLHAPAAGVVTNAGIGPASGWAGNYVAIKYPDGTHTLMAHMSTVSVQVGQTVSACQLVGAIGMTGRTFGPHVHFEVYPAGITPGDVYRAVNPVSWLNAHGLRP